MARFTLDSATEFLFGHDVKSLNEPLLYPLHAVAQSKAQAAPTTSLFKAFSLAQELTAARTRYGEHWPLLEFWKDEIAEQMKVVRSFLCPIVDEALARKQDKLALGTSGPKEGISREVQEGETLLDHLVKCTEGRCSTD